MITRKTTRDMPLQHEAETKKFDWRLLRRLLAYFKPHLKSMSFMYVLALINVGCTLAIPIVLKTGIDDYIAQGDAQGLLRIAGLLVGLVIVLFVSARGQGILVMKIGYRVLYYLRRDLFTHLQFLSFRYFDTQRAGQIMSRLTNDVQVLEELLRAGLDTILVDIVMLVGITIAMVSLDARMSVILFVTVPLFAVVVFVLRRRITEAGRGIQRRLSSVNAFLNESISGIKVIRSFAREEENSENFRSVNDEYYAQTRTFYPLIAFFWQSVATLATLGTALVLLAGGILLSGGLVTLGVIAAFLSYINRFFQPMQKLSNMINQLSRAMASAERIFELLDTEADVQDEKNAVRGVKLKGNVEFSDVWFSYERDEFVVQELSLSVTPGETIAIVGPTGAGKTTIINLLCRFYDPVRGTVLVDGHDLRELSQTDYRSQIALVMQDARIFSGTVLENIKYGKPDATLDEVRAVAESMGISSMIESFPNGYETEIGERGSSLSLGQRQVIAFARALIRDPRILILDEASAYIDSATEELVQDAMKRMSENRTTFIIAHRLATIRDADRIVVMKHGRVVETGSHTELVERNGEYAELLRNQYAAGV
ncbi:MAG: ABC transporter ATP-binding protein [Spirochaetota bacterium]